MGTNIIQNKSELIHVNKYFKEILSLFLLAQCPYLNLVRTSQNFQSCFALILFKRSRPFSSVQSKDIHNIVLIQPLMVMDGVIFGQDVFEKHEKRAESITYLTNAKSFGRLIINRMVIFRGYTGKKFLG